MERSKVWAGAFFILLTINIAALIYFTTEYKSEDISKLRTENSNLKEDYLKNAKELKYMIETLLDNSDELKEYMPEYKTQSDKDFEEALRKKVVKLDLKIEGLEKK